MPTPLTFDIFLDTTGPMAPCRLLTSADSSQPAVLPALVQADKLTVRLWLVVPATTIGAAATTLTHTGTIALAIKADQSDADMLALCTSFTSATVDGRTVYTGELNLNTAAMATAFTSPSIDTINAWFDVELSSGTNRQTFQNRVAIYREVYTGTQPPPEALPEWPMPADIPNKPSVDGYGRIVVKDGSDGLLKLSKIAFNLLSPGVVELASNTAGTLSISEPTLRIGAVTPSSSTTEMSIGNAACATDMLGDFDFTGATTNSLVRYDAEQTLTAPQQAQARANIGVVTSGGVSAVSGEMSPTTGIAATDFAAYAHTDGAVTGVLFRIVHAGGTYDVSGADSRFGSANSRGVEFVSSTGVLTFYADGVAHATTQALTAGSVVISKVLSAATGTLRSSVIFNRAMTAGERAAVMRGEFTAAMKTACLARYEPENVTSLGRWLDSSGNGYDLIPGSGITPLKPQPVQTRSARILYDYTNSVVLRKDKEFATVTKLSTGRISAVLPKYVENSNPDVIPCTGAVDVIGSGYCSGDTFYLRFAYPATDAPRDVIGGAMLTWSE